MLWEIVQTNISYNKMNIIRVFKIYYDPNIIIYLFTFFWNIF